MIASTPPFSLPIGVDFYKDISYGLYNANIVDIFKPDSVTPTPVALYIHGGGFRFSSKESFYDSQAEQDEITALLNAGICVINMDYRLISTKIDADGVFKCMDDGDTCLQWIDNSDWLNIDIAKLGILGGSAGAGMAQYLAFQLANNVLCIALSEAQSGYDIFSWGSVIGFGYNPLEFTIENNLTANFVSFYGVNSMEEVSAPSFSAQYDRVNTLIKISLFSGEIWVSNANYPNTYPVDEGHVFHHPGQALAIKAAADKQGITIGVNVPAVEVINTETRKDFLIRILNA